MAIFIRGLENINEMSRLFLKFNRESSELQFTNNDVYCCHSNHKMKGCFDVLSIVNTFTFIFFRYIYSPLFVMKNWRLDFVVLYPKF